MTRSDLFAGRLRGCLFMAAAVVALASAPALPRSAQAADDGACRAALIARGWQPFVRLAGSKAAHGDAVDLLRDELRLQRTIVTATHLDAETKRIKDDLWGSLRDFDLAGLYERLPEHDGATHALTVHGVLGPQHYGVGRMPATKLARRLDAFGESAGQLALTRLPDSDSGPGGDRYAFAQRLRANVGPVAWSAAMDSVRLGLAHMTTAAPGTAPYAMRAAAAHAGRGLALPDVELLAQLWTAFADTGRWYAGFGDFDRLRLHDRPGARPEHLDLTLSLDDKRLASTYPALADYLERVGDFVTVTLTVDNDRGQWLAARLDSAARALRVAAWSLDGRLVPSHGGLPDGHVLNATLPATRHFTSHVDLRATALGVTVKLADIVGNWVYTRGDDGAEVTGHFRRIPAIDVSGRALGIVPAGVIEAVLPTNIEDTVRDFMQVFTASHDGRGARLSLDYDNGHRASVADVALSARLLDNFFVRLGVGMVGKRLLPRADEAAGLRQMIDDGLAAYGRDLDRFASMHVPAPTARDACTR